MNVEMTGMYLNGYAKPDYKDKETGQVKLGDYIVQIQQTKALSNGAMQNEYFDIPLERDMEKKFVDKKMGDMVKVPCNVYGENFAQLKIGKAK